MTKDAIPPGLPRPAEAVDDGPGFGELRLGNLGVRLAESAREIDHAQQLRWRVFYQEMQARPSPAMAAQQRDFS